MAIIISGIVQTIPVRLKIDGLVTPEWIAGVVDYVDPVVLIGDGLITIQDARGVNAVSMEIPDNDHRQKEYQRAWNSALRYTQDRIGVDLTEFKRPFKGAI